MGGVVVETNLDKVVKGVREQGKVAKRREGGVGGLGTEGMGAAMGVGFNRGWRG